MSKIKIFLILSGYQLTWLLCIFGEILYNTFIPGLIFGLIFISICFLNTLNKKKFFLIITLISTLGYLFDTTLVYFQIYEFDTSLNIGFLPIWMIVLWPSFAILFDEVFNFLSKFKKLAVLLSSILGPMTYYAGSPLGLIYINNVLVFFILMVFFWASLMIFYLAYLFKFK